MKDFNKVWLALSNGNHKMGHMLVSRARSLIYLFCMKNSSFWSSSGYSRRSCSAGQTVRRARFVKNTETWSAGRGKMTTRYEKRAG